MHAAFYRRTEFHYWDGSYYVGVAQSLLRTATYTFNFVPHSIYPPGTPGLLALVLHFFGDAYPPMILTMTAFGALGLMATYLLLRRIENRLVSALCCILFASSPSFFKVTAIRIGSETPYLFVTMLGLLVANTLAGQTTQSRRFVLSIFLSILLVAALLIRPIGVCLAAAVALWVLWPAWFNKLEAVNRCRWFALPILAAATTHIAWTAYSRANEVLYWPGQYIHSHSRAFWMRDFLRPELGQISLLELPARCWQNLSLLPAVLAGFLFNHWVYPIIHSPVVLLTLLLLVTGMYASVRRGSATIECFYVAFYLTLLITWVYPEEYERYVIPVIPLVYLFLWRGIKWATATIPTSAPRTWLVLAATCALLAAYSAWWYATAAVARWQARASIALWLAAAAVFVYLVRNPLPRTFGGSRLVPPAIILCIVTLAVHGIFGQIQFGLANLNPPRESSRMDEVDVGIWLAANAPPSTVVMSEQESIIHRFSGRKVIDFPVTSNAHLIVDVIRRYDVGILLIFDRPRDVNFTPSQTERIRLLHKYYPGLLRRVVRLEGCDVFRVVRRALYISPGGPSTPADGLSNKPATR